MDILKVVGISDDTDKNGIGYQRVEFVKFMKDGNDEVLSNAKPRVRNLWAERKIDDDNTIAADPLFGKLTLGAKVAGSIHTFNTTPYQFEGTTTPQSQYTAVVFDGENAVSYAARQLRDVNAGVIAEDGTVVKAAPRAKASNVTA